MLKVPCASIKIVYMLKFQEKAGDKNKCKLIQLLKLNYTLKRLLL